MPHPDVTQDPIQPRIPESWRRTYESRPPELLAKDVIKLFDAQFQQKKRLQRDKDLVDAKLIVSNRRLDIANLKIWIFGALVVAQWAVILIFLKAWVDHH